MPDGRGAASFERSAAYVHTAQTKSNPGPMGGAREGKTRAFDTRRVWKKAKVRGGFAQSHGTRWKVWKHPEQLHEIVNNSPEGQRLLQVKKRSLEEEAGSVPREDSRVTSLADRVDDDSVVAEASSVGGEENT